MSYWDIRNVQLVKAWKKYLKTKDKKTALGILQRIH